MKMVSKEKLRRCLRAATIAEPDVMRNLIGKQRVESGVCDPDDAGSSKYKCSKMLKWNICSIRNPTSGIQHSETRPKGILFFGSMVVWEQGDGW